MTLFTDTALNLTAGVVPAEIDDGCPAAARRRVPAHGGGSRRRPRQSCPAWGLPLDLNQYPITGSCNHQHAITCAIVVAGVVHVRIAARSMAGKFASDYLPRRTNSHDPPYSRSPSTALHSAGRLTHSSRLRATVISDGSCACSGSSVGYGRLNCR